MSYASKAGRARVSATNPEAQAVCDRCGIWYNFNDLEWQFDWRGATLQNLRILVCKRTCLDVPQEQLRAITLPADPVPIINARVEALSEDSTDYMGWGNPQYTRDPATGIPVISQDVMGWDSTTPVAGQQPVGPTATTKAAVLNPGIGLDPAAQMAFVGQTHWAKPLAVLSMTANGTDLITVTCSAPHGLTSGQQVAVSGVTNPQAWGFFNATVISGTAFTYRTNNAVKAGSVMGPAVTIITSNAGVPWNMTDVPKTGI